ncbi:MAG: copper amine oxidase N-terminal domain-containing protein [Patescibacteria group bacterium]|nr:copper amine oxidase N-terminal domain-containing protein [Patescibacteria group bacterium]
MKQSKQTLSSEPAWDFTIPDFISHPPIQVPKLSLTTHLFILVIFGFVINQILLFKINANTVNSKSLVPPTASPSPMTLSAFDQNMITKLKNEGKPYPILGSAHNHANITVFINGRQYDFAKSEYYMKSTLLHVDNNQDIKDAGSVLHMHAKDVPMWWFFESLGMKLTKDSLTTASGEVLKNENGKTLKFYLNGKKVDELGNYVFQPLDKLLISFGPENDPGIQSQIDSVPNFAKDHQK